MCGDVLRRLLMIFNLIHKAKDLFFDKTSTSLSSNNVQDAIKELDTTHSSAIRDAQTYSVGVIVKRWSQEADYTQGYKQGEIRSHGGAVYRCTTTGGGKYPWDSNAPWETVYLSDIIEEHQAKLDVIGELQTVIGDKLSVEPQTGSTGTTLANILLKKGIYSVTCQVNFQTYGANNGNYRRVCLLESANVTSTALGVTNACAPATGITTSLQINSIMNVTADKTYYLNAQHDAGAAIDLQGQIRAVRIA